MGAIFNISANMSLSLQRDHHPFKLSGLAFCSADVSILNAGLPAYTFYIRLIAYSWITVYPCIILINKEVKIYITSDSIYLACR